MRQWRGRRIILCINEPLEEVHLDPKVRIATSKRWIGTDRRTDSRMDPASREKDGEDKGSPRQGGCWDADVDDTGQKGIRQEAWGSYSSCCCC
jgi:hypothetical protein